MDTQYNKKLALTKCVKQ